MDASSEDQPKKEVKPSILSLISPQRNEPKEMCYFNSKTKLIEVSMFDRMYHNIEDFDTKMKYHTLKHSRERGLDINEEEKSRPVALLSSSEYGRRLNSTINRTAMRRPRVALIKSDFYRKSGIIWSLAEGYGPVVPL